MKCKGDLCGKALTCTNSCSGKTENLGLMLITRGKLGPRKSNLLCPWDPVRVGPVFFQKRRWPPEKWWRVGKELEFSKCCHLFYLDLGLFYTELGIRGHLVFYLSCNIPGNFHFAPPCYTPREREHLLRPAEAALLKRSLLWERLSVSTQGTYQGLLSIYHVLAKLFLWATPSNLSLAGTHVPYFM